MYCGWYVVVKRCLERSHHTVLSGGIQFDNTCRPGMLITMTLFVCLSQDFRAASQGCGPGMMLLHLPDLATHDHLPHQATST